MIVSRHDTCTIVEKNLSRFEPKGGASEKQRLNKKKKEKIAASEKKTFRLDTLSLARVRAMIKRGELSFSVVQKYLRG